MNREKKKKFWRMERASSWPSYTYVLVRFAEQSTTRFEAVCFSGSRSYIRYYECPHRNDYGTLAPRIAVNAKYNFAESPVYYTSVSIPGSLS